MHNDEYISTAESAIIMKLSQQHVRRLCAEGILRHKRIGKTTIVLKIDAEKYEKRAPGIKLGQKIKRKKKGA